MYGDFRLLHRHDDERDADRGAIDQSRAEICLEAAVPGDAGSELLGVRMQGKPIDAGVPDVVIREDGTARYCRSRLLSTGCRHGEQQGSDSGDERPRGTAKSFATLADVESNRFNPPPRCGGIGCLENHA